MRIAIAAESSEGETRVPIVPETVSRLVRDGHKVILLSGAGQRASLDDEAYRAAGADVAGDIPALFRDVDIAVKIGRPTDEELANLPRGAAIIGMLQARNNPDLLKTVADASLTAFSMELIPRIARAQRLDVLSSQASLAGYKAVLIAANSLGKFFPLMMTAAGTIPPAQVLILGAGVAGLQAIATARRLGANVEAFDVRPAVKEQVESLGADFVDVPAPQGEQAETAGGYAREQSEEALRLQQETLAAHVAKADVVVTTAQIPGRPAPTLVTEDMVKSMRPGSVIVDLAAETGGNCEATQPNQTATVHGVIIHGPFNVPAMMPMQASVLYSRNVHGLLELLTGEDGQLKVNFDDRVISDACVAHQGELVGLGRQIVSGET